MRGKRHGVAVLRYPSLKPAARKCKVGHCPRMPPSASTLAFARKPAFSRDAPNHWLIMAGVLVPPTSVGFGASLTGCFGSGTSIDWAESFRERCYSRRLALIILPSPSPFPRCLACFGVWSFFFSTPHSSPLSYIGISANKWLSQVILPRCLLLGGPKIRCWNK